MRFCARRGLRAGSNRRSNAAYWGDLLEWKFELENSNIKLAKMNRISNDIEPSDLGVHERE
jgi:hypothetical protein